MVEDLIPHLNMFKQNTSTAGIGEDQAEENRRLELSRYVRQSPAILTIANGLHSALEHIENRSRALLGKGTAARFMDKGKDSKEVANLINGLREAISHYQVSRSWTAASSTVTHTRGTDIAAASNLPPSY